jgi:hypothetical protein
MPSDEYFLYVQIGLQGMFSILVVNNQKFLDSYNRYWLYITNMLEL